MCRHEWLKWQFSSTERTFPLSIISFIPALWNRTSHTAQKKAANAHEEKVNFPQWLSILTQFERIGIALEVRWDGQVPDDEQAEDEKAQILIVQPKPTLGSRWITIIGKMTPPRDERAIAKSPTITRLLWKYVMGQGITKSVLSDRVMMRSVYRCNYGSKD